MDTVDIPVLTGLSFVGYYLFRAATTSTSKSVKTISILGIVVLLVIAYYLFFVQTREIDMFGPNHKGIENNDDSVVLPNEVSDVLMSEVQDDFSIQPLNLALSEDVESIQKDSGIGYNGFLKKLEDDNYMSLYKRAMIASLELKGGKLRDLMNKTNVKIDTGISALKIDPLRHFRSLSKLLQARSEEIENMTLSALRHKLIRAMKNPKDGLESLIGREDIKDFIAGQLYTFSMNPNIFLSSFQNIALYGPSGIGKTKIGKVIGFVYSNCGILLRPDMKTITKKDITTGYVNESGRLMSEMLMSNIEGVILLDEAYDLSPPQGLKGLTVDHGAEAITEMVNFMDKAIGISVVIVAGYEKEMEARFMTANEGLPRRFPNVVVLKPYTAKDLTQILLQMIKLQTKGSLRLRKEDGDLLHTLILHVNERYPIAFDKQAGDMINLATDICKSIYNSSSYKWPRDSKILLINGFNVFLSKKGVVVSETPDL